MRHIVISRFVNTRFHCIKNSPDGCITHISDRSCLTGGKLGWQKAQNLASQKFVSLMLPLRKLPIVSNNTERPFKCRNVATPADLTLVS